MGGYTPIQVPGGITASTPVSSATGTQPTSPPPKPLSFKDLVAYQKTHHKAGKTNYADDVHQAMRTARIKAQQAGQPFDEQEWMKNYVGGGAATVPAAPPAPTAAAPPPPPPSPGPEAHAMPVTQVRPITGPATPLPPPPRPGGPAVPPEVPARPSPELDQNGRPFAAPVMGENGLMASRSALNPGGQNVNKYEGYMDANFSF